MKRGLTGDKVGLSQQPAPGGPKRCCTPGLDLSRQRLDVHVLDEEGRTVETTAVRPDADALRTLVSYVQRHGEQVSAAIESMTGARFVHDQLELAGWDVAIGDAAKVKGIAPLAAKTDSIDAYCARGARPAGPRPRPARYPRVRQRDRRRDLGRGRGTSKATGVVRTCPRAGSAVIRCRRKASALGGGGKSAKCAVATQRIEEALVRATSPSRAPMSSSPQNWTRCSRRPASCAGRRSPGDA